MSTSTPSIASVASSTSTPSVASVASPTSTSTSSPTNIPCKISASWLLFNQIGTGVFFSLWFISGLCLVRTSKYIGLTDNKYNKYMILFSILLLVGLIAGNICCGFLIYNDGWSASYAWQFFVVGFESLILTGMSFLSLLFFINFEKTPILGRLLLIIMLASAFCGLLFPIIAAVYKYKYYNGSNGVITTVSRGWETTNNQWEWNILVSFTTENGNVVQNKSATIIKSTSDDPTVGSSVSIRYKPQFEKGQEYATSFNVIKATLI